MNILFTDKLLAQTPLPENTGVYPHIVDYYFQSSYFYLAILQLILTIISIYIFQFRYKKILLAILYSSIIAVLTYFISPILHGSGLTCPLPTYSEIIIQKFFCEKPFIPNILIGLISPLVAIVMNIRAIYNRLTSKK
ncbi:MAG: hypothetical protein XD93_0750 [candidate division WS6 bacterium 34_10]|uniref:Uncharacterized protein n=1 Tax=candidate division WS6 bacterium 34_10 TaxID=1641389 RepID=A0A101HH32_9BACT|nr:MAG: hypothetical protein XD93_0750 [candidate division WS6 bacterium 34_10]